MLASIQTGVVYEYSSQSSCIENFSHVICDLLNCCNFILPLSQQSCYVPWFYNWHMFKKRNNFVGTKEYLRVYVIGALFNLLTLIVELNPIFLCLLAKIVKLSAILILKRLFLFFWDKEIVIVNSFELWRIMKNVLTIGIWYEKFRRFNNVF